MRTSNFGKGRRVAGFFRICVCILIALILATGGMALNTAPVQAHAPITYVPPGIMPDCTTFTVQFNHGPTSCPQPAGCTAQPTYFWWLTGAPPLWVNIDQTGLLTVCAPKGTLTTGPFTVWCTEFDCCCFLPWIHGSTCPAIFEITSIPVTLNFGPGPTGPLTINTTFIPPAWENMPFYMALSATGCTGTYTWGATGLPAWLTLDPNLGTITGIPPPGTCNMYYNVTVTCTDTVMCTDATCCPPATRPLVLFVDCWANYFPLVTIYYTTACDFKVNIGTGLAYGKTNVVIDGIPKTTLGGNQSETFTSIPCKSHLVVVDQIVQGPDSKTRYACIGSNQKWVSDTDNYAYFDYAQEVYIETGSDPSGISQPPGTGYYAIGNSFISTASSPVDSNIQKGIRYIFRAWSLPDGSTLPNRDLLFTVNRAGTTTAKYDTYYLLNIVSDDPSVSESSWELKDSTATYNLALQALPIPNFWGIIGGVKKPINASGTHVMTGPYTQKILWSYDYTVPIIVIAVTLLVIIGLVVFLVLRRKRAGVSAIPAATLAQVSQPPAVAPEAAQTTPVVTATDEKKALPETESEDKPNFCPKCGNPVEKDAIFCKKCGNKLVKENK